MSKPLISCIIPVFNVEKYLLKCIESVISQSFKNWEVLLIDDGSTDSSGKICDELVKIDRRIRVFHKPNGGVSSARNLGINEACADWITFVDSDDYLQPSFFEGLYKPVANGNEIDFVQGGCVNVVNDKVVSVNQLYEDFIGNAPDFIFNKFRGLTFSKLFKTSLLRLNSEDVSPLFFDENMTHAEDMAFTLDYLLRIKEYALVSEKGYCYRIDNMNSATKSKIVLPYEKKLHSYKHLYCSTMNYIRKYHLSEEQSKLRLQQQGNNLVSTICTLYVNKQNDLSTIAHLTSDFSDEERALLNYSSVSPIIKMVFLCFKFGYFKTFDKMMSIIYKIKR